MRSLILLITLFTFSSLQAQNFTVETRVDEWDENKVNLSFEFSEAVEPIGNLQDELPLPFLITSPVDKYVVDSVTVNNNDTLFDIYLSLEDSTDYSFVAPVVVSKQEDTVLNRININFSTDHSERYELNGVVKDNLGLTKVTQTNTNDNFVTGISLIALLDVDAEDSLKYHSSDPESLLTLTNSFSKHIQSLDYYDSESFSLSYSEKDTVILAHVFFRYVISFENEVRVYDPVLTIFVGNNSDAYRFSQQDSSNIELYVGTTVSNEQDLSSPTSFELSAYPNPFNPSTQLQYTLPEAGSVSISVFNVLGQQVRTLAEGTRSSGVHNTRFNATGLPAGMYMIRLESIGQSGNVFTETKKVMLLK
jgi:hypothetical protein